MITETAVDPTRDDPPPVRVRAPLEGREDVLAVAMRRWSEASGGDGRMLLLAGEAGIGKSRMLDEIADRVGDPVILTTRAWPRDAEVPGGVLLDFARTLRGGVAPEIGAALRERLLEVDGGGDASRRYRLLVVDLADLVLEVLGTAPTLLRVEDLHWADELSLDVLDRLTPSLRHLPVLVVATYRSDEVRPGSALAVWRARLLGQRLAEEVRIPRLDRAATGRLAESLLGRVPSAALVDELFARSDGIPLSVEELIALGDDTVPETIAEAVRQRAARLARATQELAAAAAVVGCSFDFDLFVDIVQRPPEEVGAALRELCEWHLMQDLGDGRFDFRHALLRDALYAELPVDRRRRLHAAVATASERAGIRRSYLSEQYERAGMREPAHRFAVEAADAAAAISAHREAAELFARALRTAPASVPPADLAELTARAGRELLGIDRAADAAELLRLAIDRFLALGDRNAAACLVGDLMAARHLLGDDLDHRIALAGEARGWLADAPDGGSDAAWSHVLGAEAAAYMLARRLDESIEAGTAALARAVRDDPGGVQVLDIQTTLGAVQVFAGDQTGWQLLEQVIAAATGPDEESVAARARRMLATSASVLVEYDLAAGRLEEGLAFTAATERWNDHHYLRAHRAHVRWATGAPGASRDAERALADGVGRTTEIEALKVLGYVDLARGRLDDAERRLRRSLELGLAMAELQRISPALWGLAEVALHRGDTARAIELCEEGLERSAAVADAAYLFPFVLTGVRARLAGHDLDGARDWVARAAEPIRRRGIPGTLPALDHAEGLLLLAEGRSTAAREPLERAVAEWTARHRVWEGVQGLLDLARCAARARRPAEAAALVADARNRAADAGAILLVRSADTIRLNAGESSAGPLTAREFEVARLVAEGATNRQIAERLYISPKTVSAHLEHILAKLKVARRAEVAAWVIRETEDPAP